MDKLWSFKDEFDNEFELMRNGDDFTITIHDSYESSYVALSIPEIQDLFDVLGNALGVFSGTARHDKIPQRNMVTGEIIPSEHEPRCS